MAREYDASKETREVLAEVQKNSRGEYIIVTKITNNESSAVSLDIRLYYTNDADEVCPTGKGVRMNTEIASEVLAGAVDVLETNELMDLVDKINEIIAEREGESEE